MTGQDKAVMAALSSVALFTGLPDEIIGRIAARSAPKTPRRSLPPSPFLNSCFEMAAIWTGARFRSQRKGM